MVGGGGLRLIECPQRILKEVEASREYPISHKKRIWKNGIRRAKFFVKRIMFLEKDLSSGKGISLLGISEVVQRQLKVWTSGDFATEVDEQIPATPPT